MQYMAYYRLDSAEGRIVNGKTELKRLSRVQHRRTETGNMQERLRAVGEGLEVLTDCTQGFTHLLFFPSFAFS